MLEKTPIFIMFEDKIEWTKICLEYLRENTDKSEYRLILINNGSIESNADKIQSLIEDGDEFVNFKNQVSVSFAYNNAIRKYIGKSDRFVILHNDCFVSNGWLKRMNDHADKVDCFSSIFPRTNYSTESTAMNRDEDIYNRFIKFKPGNKTSVTEKDIRKIINSTYLENDSFEVYCASVSSNYDRSFAFSEEICNFCTMFNVSFYNEFGGFDEDFISSGCQYKIYNYQCNTYGIQSMMALDVFVHHNGNTTTDSIGRDFVLDRKIEESVLEKKISEIIENKRSKAELNTKIEKNGISVLFIRNDGIGDIIMSLFALEGIKREFSGIDITYATRIEFMDFVSGFSCIDKVVPLPNYEPEDLVTINDIQSVEAPYSDRFDIIFNFVKYFEVVNKKDKSNRVEQVINYVSMVHGGIFQNIKTLSPKYIINRSIPESIEYIKDMDKPIIGISPYGSCPIRSMNKNVFEKIIEIESKTKIVLILGKDKIDINSKNITERNVVNLSGETKIEDLPPLLKECEYVYTSDSGVFHMSGVLNVPCRAFFGTIDPKTRDGFYPSSDKNIIYYKKELKCVPCLDIGCCDVKCMDYNEEEIEKIVSGEKINYA